MYIHVHVYTCRCMCIHMYMYKYIHVHIYTYTCTCTCTSRCMKSKGKIENQELHELESNARSNVRCQTERKEFYKVNSSSLNISHRIQIIPLATSIPSIRYFSQTLIKCHFFLLFGPVSYWEVLSITWPLTLKILYIGWFLFDGNFQMGGEVFCENFQCKIKFGCK